jgi:hypothetical protein
MYKALSYLGFSFILIVLIWNQFGVAVQSESTPPTTSPPPPTTTTTSSSTQPKQNQEDPDHVSAIETLFDEVLRWGVMQNVISQEQKEILAKEYIQRFEKIQNASHSNPFNITFLFSSNTHFYWEFVTHSLTHSLTHSPIHSHSLTQQNMHVCGKW